MEQDQAEALNEPVCFLSSLERIPQIVNTDDVKQIIDLQRAAIDLLENTNKSLTDCNNLAQSKLSTTTKLFKKTAKSIAESKKDLDVIYKKIIDLKAKLKAEKPHLFEVKSVGQVHEDRKEDIKDEQIPADNLDL